MLWFFSLCVMHSSSISEFTKTVKFNRLNIQQIFCLCSRLFWMNVEHDLQNTNNFGAGGECEPFKGDILSFFVILLSFSVLNSLCYCAWKRSWNGQTPHQQKFCAWTRWALTDCLSLSHPQAQAETWRPAPSSNGGEVPKCGYTSWESINAQCNKCFLYVRVGTRAIFQNT